MRLKSKSPVCEATAPMFVSSPANKSEVVTGRSLWAWTRAGWASLLIATLIASGSQGWAVTPTEKAQGEQLLVKARQDLAQAKAMQDASVKLAKAAQQDAIKANEKKAEAHALLQAAYLLIRDANRMRADDLRVQAGAKELQAQNAEVERTRVEGLLAHEKRTAADAAAAASKVQEASRNESNAQEKAELMKMADSLTKQGAQSTNEIAGFEKRIAALDGEIGRLKAEFKAMNDEAARLDPSVK